MTQPVVAMSGSSGLIGTAVARALGDGGYTLRRLVRGRATREGEFSWNPAEGTIDSRAVEGADAVIHLAGENIGRRWTTERRKAIRESRVQGTTTIARAIAQAKRAPSLLISGSAVGYYGDRGDEELDEGSTSGSGFLASVCRDWEGATRAASAAGVRTVILRPGVVLTRRGGALARMLPPFRMGAGGRLGSGAQWMSWIALADMVRVIRFLLRHPTLSGPVNAVAPNPVTNAEFTSALGQALHRPAIIPVPELALKLAFGQMAEETLLASQRARPRVLLAAGFEFERPTVEGALRGELAG